jgi:hypothetical protein
VQFFLLHLSIICITMPNVMFAQNFHFVTVVNLSINPSVAVFLGDRIMDISISLK